VEIELYLGDRSVRFGVRRDPALCGNLNRDIDNICG
jgi:hypothetical protein